MIETVMIFALGFLAASLCALLLLPAVGARALRLARRRVEAALPLSPVEVAAEKDFLRAQFAVEQRRMERRVEAAQARRGADMAAIGARTMEAAALNRDLAQRKAEIAAGLAERARLEGELDTAREDGSASLATLNALEEAHADLVDTLIAARRAAPADGPAVTAVGPATKGDGGNPTADLRARLAETEAALARAANGHGDAIERENADLRRRIAEVADMLTGRERLPVAGPFPAPEPVQARS